MNNNFILLNPHFLTHDKLKSFTLVNNDLDITSALKSFWGQLSSSFTDTNNEIISDYPMKIFDIQNMRSRNFLLEQEILNSHKFLKYKELPSKTGHLSMVRSGLNNFSGGAPHKGHKRDKNTKKRTGSSNNDYSNSDEQTVDESNEQTDDDEIDKVIDEYDEYDDDDDEFAIDDEYVSLSSPQLKFDYFINSLANQNNYLINLNLAKNTQLLLPQQINQKYLIY